jgi:hypothetical protein
MHKGVGNWTIILWKSNILFAFKRKNGNML